MGLTEKEAIEQFGESAIESYIASFSPLEWSITEQHSDLSCFAKVVVHKELNNKVTKPLRLLLLLILLYLFIVLTYKLTSSLWFPGILFYDVMLWGWLCCCARFLACTSPVPVLERSFKASLSR